MAAEILSLSLVSLSAIFFVVDPFSAVPFFLAMTSHDPTRRTETALRAAVTAGVVELVVNDTRLAEAMSAASQAALGTAMLVSVLGTVVGVMLSRAVRRPIERTRTHLREEGARALEGLPCPEIEDLDRILALPYLPVEPDTRSYFREKEELGNRGLMMTDIGDPLQPLYHLMSAENFSLFSATDYEKILEFTDEMYRRVTALYRYLLERNVGEVFFIVGAEFAGPPLVAPQKFNELSARYVKGIVDLIREYGKWSIVHYHGNLYKVLGGMKEINPDGLHTIEAPPIGDCTIAHIW
jgi:hypothetical protein